MSERKMRDAFGMDIFYRPLERNREEIIRAIEIANTSGFSIQVDFILSPEVRPALLQILAYTNERILSLTQVGKNLLKNIENISDGDTISLEISPKFGDKSLFPYKNKIDSLVKILLSSSRLELKKSKQYK